MTTVADVISQAMIIIDDVRMQKELAVNPALFYRRYSEYVSPALTLLNNPPELYEYVTNGYTAPTYADYEWVSTEDSTTEETVLETELTEYELVSAVIISEDGMSRTVFTDFTYDAETGEITIPPQPNAGRTYEFDFYTDGKFENMTERIKRLLALAIAIIWDERFTRNWLNMQPKIKDASFETINEANYMDKLTSRMTMNRQNFSDELRKYEQSYAYRNVVGGIKPRDVFI